MYYNDGSKFKAQILDDNTKPVGKNKVMNLVINKKAYKVKGPAVIDLTIKTDSVVLPMLKPGGTFNNLILRREDISDAEK